MKASLYDVLMDTLPNGAEVWLSAEPEDISTDQEARALDDGQGSGERFKQAVLEAVQRWGRWGWCSMKITYAHQGREGTAYLGCCSYEGPQDFRARGYYEQKVSEAYHNWCNPPGTGG